MHSLLVSTSPLRDRSTVAAWIAGAVGRGERVLYKHAPTEDAAAVLGRSLPEVGLDPMPRSLSGSSCSGCESAERDCGRAGMADAGGLVPLLDPVAVVPGSFDRSGAAAFAAIGNEQGGE
jgi:hypothetical protein